MSECASVHGDTSCRSETVQPLPVRDMDDDDLALDFAKSFICLTPEMRALLLAEIESS